MASQAHRIKLNAQLRAANLTAKVSLRSPFRLSSSSGVNSSESTHRQCFTTPRARLRFNLCRVAPSALRVLYNIFLTLSQPLYSTKVRNQFLRLPRLRQTRSLFLSSDQFPQSDSLHRLATIRRESSLVSHLTRCFPQNQSPVEDRLSWFN